MSDSVTLWTVAPQAPLSRGFSRQEYRSGVPFPPPGDLPYPGIEPASLMSPALAGRFFTTSITWEAPMQRKVKVAQLCPTLCDPMDWEFSRPHGLGILQARIFGVGSLSLLQRIFLAQELNWGLLNCRQFLYQLSYEASLPCSVRMTYLI